MVRTVKMKNWIIIHHFSSYLEHNDLIGIPARLDKETNKLLPKYSAAEEIQNGDQFAYYCPAPKKVVIGLFEIIDGPGVFADDWNDSIHFRMKPIFPVDLDTNSVPYHDLVNNLNYFKDTEGNVLRGPSASLKLKGTIKSIDNEDFNKILELYKKTEIIPQPEDSLHINMIKISHLQANQFQCYSFVGSQERNRVYNSVSDDEEIYVSGATMEDLPSWLSDIGNQLGTQQRIRYIDNLWFFEESPGFYIPFAAIEHEKDANLRGVMDRFTGLNNTLNSNKHLKEIDPIYFLIAKDSNQAESYERKINEHGEWRLFKRDHKFFIFAKPEIENRTPKYVQILTEHLKSIPYYEG